MNTEEAAAFDRKARRIFFNLVCAIPCGCVYLPPILRGSTSILEFLFNLSQYIIATIMFMAIGECILDDRLAVPSTTIEPEVTDADTPTASRMIHGYTWHPGIEEHATRRLDQDVSTTG